VELHHQIPGPVGQIAPFGGAGHLHPVEGQEEDLGQIIPPACGELEEPEGDLARVGDVADGELEAVGVVGDLVEIPLLDPPRGNPDLLPVVGEERFGGVTSLGQRSLRRQKWPRLHNAVLHTLSPSGRQDGPLLRRRKGPNLP